MEMHNPPHPGEILKEEIIHFESITVTAAAKTLGITRKHLSAICNGRSSITPYVAIKLEREFNLPTAEVWLQMQAAHDLWALRHPE